MKSFALVVVFLLSVTVDTQEDILPWIEGGLDWSSDGEYIAVGTTAGVYIHAGDDLSIVGVLDETFDVRNLAWSNTDTRIAYNDFTGDRVAIWDLATRERTEIETVGWIGDVEWSPTDKNIAATGGHGGFISIWDVETGAERNSISLTQFAPIGTPLMTWSPDGRYIAFGAISNGFVIFNAYTGHIFDFMWHKGIHNPLRWSPDGNLLAARGEQLKIWEINQIYHPHDSVDAFIGDVVYERADGGSPSWHPDSTKIAFVDTVWSKEDPYDFTGSHAEIWDLASNTNVELPGGVFIAFAYNIYDAIAWSHDGSKLASISSDGRIVMWDARTYKIVAEHKGYPSLVDLYAENH
ncbi:MAG: WD40 repeat domain-containing protein [Chloroflexi bacterium]|nr:WD40 repeat domain-containing protein [Chloroflexota bacterium]